MQRKRKIKEDSCEKTILIFAGSAILSGCAHVDVQEISRGASIGFFGTPIGAAASIIGLVSSITTGSSRENEHVSEKSKRFVLSKEVENDFSNDGNFMDLIMIVQEKFKTGEWGDVTPQQAQINNANPIEAIGRYPADQRSVLVVTDAGNEYRICYEGESWPELNAKGKNSRSASGL